MTTITTAVTDVQERLSMAYLMAVAARAGCQVTYPPVDRNGIDATIKPIQGAPVALDVQMKAVSTDRRISDGKILSFQLDIPTYDKLRRRDAVNPQLLVVYEMPALESQWLEVRLNPSPIQTIMRHAAYWADLRGLPDVTTATTAVHIPVTQVFDPLAIRDILARAHERAKRGLSWD